MLTLGAGTVREEVRRSRCGAGNVPHLPLGGSTRGGHAESLCEGGAEARGHVASHPSMLTPSSHLNRSLGDLNASSNLRTDCEERLWSLVGSGTGGGKERKGGAPWDPGFPT